MKKKLFYVIFLVLFMGTIISGCAYHHKKSLLEYDYPSVPPEEVVPYSPYYYVPYYPYPYMYVPYPYYPPSYYFPPYWYPYL